MANTCARIVEFSTDFLPEQEPIAYWRKPYGHVMLRVDIEAAKDVPFQDCITSLSAPGLQLIEASSSPTRISRTGKYLADGNDDAVLVINRTGIAAISSGGRQETLNEQEAILVMGNEPISFCRTGRGRPLTLRVPQAMLRSIVADADDTFMRLIPRNRSALGLLSRYAGSLLRVGASMDSELENLSVRHIQDILALTLGATNDFAKPHVGVDCGRSG